MNTIKKIIASSVVNGTAAYFVKDEILSFGESFGVFALLSGLPVVADKYINQNITSNKAIQYGLTAAEATLGLGILCGFNKAQKNEKFSVNEFKGFFSALFSTDLKTIIKTITGITIAFSFAHKYIWDQPNDTNVELDYQPEEIIIPIDVLETIQESI